MASCAAAYATLPANPLMSIVLVSNEIKVIPDWVTRESALCIAFCWHTNPFATVSVATE